MRVDHALEVMHSSAHVAFEMRDVSQVGEARRAAVQRGESLGLDAVAVGRIALVVTELGNNLIRHAREGRLLLNDVATPDGVGMVEVLSIDRGPGMADLSACLKDGFSTAGTPGTGLGAVRRLSDVFDAYSTLPGGTLVMSRVGGQRVGAGAPAPRFVFGSVALPATGETVCGDACSVALAGHRASVIVADGLGHGPGAHAASSAAVAEFRSAGLCGPSEMLQRVHQQLRSTRGAAVAISNLDSEDGSLLFCGAGNIVGRILSGVEDRTLLSQHGTAGLQIRTPRDVRYEWPQHALLIMHSDGLISRWDFKAAPGLLRKHPTIVAAWLVREQRRGADDVTVVVLARGAQA